MKIRPYSPVALPGNQPNVRNSRQPAISPRFEGSSDDIPILPVLIGCAGGVAFLLMVAAYMTSDSRRFRSRGNHDLSNGIYTPSQDTFELSSRREPIVVHNNWNNSDVTINAEQHSNVLLENIRQPEPAIIRNTSNRHAEHTV